MEYVVDNCIVKMALVGHALGIKGTEDEAVAHEAPDAVSRLLESI